MGKGVVIAYIPGTTGNLKDGEWAINSRDVVTLVNMCIQRGQMISCLKWYEPDEELKKEIKRDLYEEER